MAAGTRRGAALRLARGCAGRDAVSRGIAGVSTTSVKLMAIEEGCKSSSNWT